MITKPHARPFTYPITQEYAALGLDPTKIEALYLFDPAGNLYDASGNQRHGDISVTSGFSGTGRYGTGMFFDGVNDIVVLDNSTGLNFGDGTTDTPFSVSVWVNPDATLAGSTFLVGKNSGAGAREWQVTIDLVGAKYSISMVLIDDSVPVITKTDSNVALHLDPSSWNHVVCTYDPSIGSGATAANGMNIYINRVFDSAPTRTNVATYVAMEAQASEIAVGARGDGASYTKGIMDNVLIYSEALNLNQIQNLYNKGL